MPRPPRLLAAGFLVALFTSFATAQETVPITESDAVVLADGSQLWFIQLSGPPVADGGSETSLLNEQAAFRSAASRAGVSFVEQKSFRTLWNGLSVAIQPYQLGRVRQLAGVSEIFPVAIVEASPFEPVSQPELLTALSMTGADVAQNDLGLTGAGVKVGIIDSGVDYDHPDLGGDGTARTNSTMFPNSRVAYGHDFVGDAFNPSGGVLTRVPDPYPDGCDAHGTHVAGIVGANGAVKGVAPGVTFGAYKVFGCFNTTAADVMIEAMEQALADGMDIINMSIGSSGQWPSYPTAAAATRLVNQGVIVVCSIGNSGANGLYFASAPGVGAKSIGTASFENTHINLNAFSATPDDAKFGYFGATAAPPPPTSGTQSLTRTGTVASLADACAALPPGSLAGKVALIRRGTCGFYQKVKNAEAAGAIGVVLYNNVPGSFGATVAGTPPVVVPVVTVSGVDGGILDGRIASGPVDITWGQIISSPNATGGKIATSSSYGLSPDLEVKPDIGAPGGFIRSTFPLELGGYDNISGTSMASPHVAGAAALVLEAHPNTPSNAMRDILQNNATPHTHRTVPGLDNVHRQGAGMLNIPAAVLATTRITPGKISVGETELGPVTRTFTIHNNGASDATYDLANLPALATGTNPFVPSQLAFGASVTFVPNPVVVPAGGSAQVDATFTPSPSLPQGSAFGGYVTVTPQGGEAQHVPYAGITGNYQSLPGLAPTPNNFPWLARRTGTTFTNQPAGATYTMVNPDNSPWVLIHVDHPVSIVRAEVYAEGTGKAWHRAIEIEDLARNSTATSFYSLGWNGTTSSGNKVYTVPNGQYRIHLLVRKALGDGSPADMDGDWNTWISPLITIARPGPGASLAQGTSEPMGDMRPTELFLASLDTNPFSGPATLRFGLPRSSGAALEVFDMAGRRLREWSWGELPAGEHLVTWDGTDQGGRSVGAGVFFYRLRALDQTLTRKAVRVE